MKVRWKRIRKTDKEIYYFDSRQAEDAELCGKLLHRMIEEVRFYASGQTDPPETVWAP